MHLNLNKWNCFLLSKYIIKTPSGDDGWHWDHGSHGFCDGITWHLVIHMLPHIVNMFPFEWKLMCFLFFMSLNIFHFIQSLDPRQWSAGTCSSLGSSISLLSSCVVVKHDNIFEFDASISFYALDLWSMTKAMGRLKLNNSFLRYSNSLVIFMVIFVIFVCNNNSIMVMHCDSPLQCNWG